jgi:hypothetical protein
MNNRTTQIFLLTTAGAFGLAGPVEVKATPDISEYCHIIRFAMGWGKIQADPVTGYPRSFTYEDSDYEFRIAGMEPNFLIRGLDPLTHNYTSAIYEVNLSDPKSTPRISTEEAWRSGTPVKMIKKEAWDTRYPNGGLTNSTNLPYDQPIRFHSLTFEKTGAYWPGDKSLLSPDQSVVVIQSWTGSLAHSSDDVPLGLSFGRSKGKLFYDVFRVDTAKKMFTILGTYTDIHPERAFAKTGWVTERYFIIPLGARERCLICEFGRKTKREGDKP